MPLLKPASHIKEMPVKLSIKENILCEIEAYVAWAGMDRIDDFFEEAALYVFKKDKPWRDKRKAMLAKEKSENAKRSDNETSFNE